MKISVFYPALFGAASFDLPSNTTITRLFQLISEKFHIPTPELRCTLNERPFGDQQHRQNRTLSEEGISGDVTLFVTRVPVQQQQQQPTTPPLQPSGGGGDWIGSMVNRLQQQAATPPPQQPQQQVQNPDWVGSMVQRLNQAASLPTQLPNEEDPEFQRRMLEAIERNNVEQNFLQGIEHNPESFGRVVMLYVKCEVNRVPCTAFVDSGAQMSIMSQSCAERCGILRLVDRRFQGMAHGVGQTKILGRVHVTIVNLGGLALPFSISVLETQKQDIDFIIGLDQLRRHQMCIDLKDCVLRVGDVALPFLPEGELPESVRRTEVGEPEGQPTTATTAPAGGPLPPERERMVQQMISLGSTRELSIQLLEASEWNLDVATSLL